MLSNTTCDVDLGKKSIEHAKPSPTPIAAGFTSVKGRVPEKDGKRGVKLRKISVMMIPNSEVKAVFGLLARRRD
jgi:hypothetical protein